MEGQGHFRTSAARATLIAALWACAAAIPSASAAVRLNELVAAPSDRLLRIDSNGVPRVGTGLSWMESAFDATAWSQGPGPFGFGTGYTTDLSSARSGLSLSLYLRKPFVVAATNAAGTNEISLTMNYDSGFVAYLNGRELLRRNLGAPGTFVYCDQPAFNLHKAGTNETWVLGVASNLLAAGTNVLALQVHSYGTTSFCAGPKLAMAGPTGEVALADVAGPWAYAVGDCEPSGGIPDGSTPPASVRGREWALIGFADDGWPAGPGGIGFADNDDATDVSNQMYGICSALYLRRSFVVSEETASLTNALEFIVNYDDGYVAYLNGAEISRANMGAPGSSAPYTMFATASHEATTPATNQFGAASVWLLPGTNVLAVQVHNVTLTSSDLSLIADLRVAGGADLVRHGDSWRYFVGTESPVFTGDEEEGDDEEVLYDADFADWIELYNDGASPVALGGWSLTDDDDDPGRWRFPAAAVLGPRQYLLVLCTGRDIRDAGAPVWHTNFKLEGGGEYVGLYDGTGTAVSEIAPRTPPQSAFHSYGWSASAGAWRYYADPTPGRTNDGASLAGMCAAPAFVTAAGFYSNAIVVAITSATPSATIRYTVDGTEPTETRGAVYAGGIALSTTASVRARAFLSGWVPSPVSTRSFLVNPPALLRRSPALLLTGPWEDAFHKSNGVMTIVGGAWTGGLWYAQNIENYNIPLKHGRAFEKPISLEVISPTNNAAAQVDAGLRIAGSGHARPRYVLQAMSNTWYGSWESKPQFNVFFRSEYGEEPFDFKLNAAFLPKTPYESLRFRSGKNDYNRPFIRDELMRRLYALTGQPSGCGLIAGLYVNGIFRCYYNPVERYDTGYLQARHGGTNAWDIINHGGVTEGDTVALNAMMYLATNKDLTVLSNYVAVTEKLDVVNLADYILANAYGATWDWPHNNYYCACERGALGRFRFYMWDAEGAFGVSFKTNNFDILYECITNRSTAARSAQLFRCLHKSPEFRLLMADRIHRHFFNGGAYTYSNVVARFDALREEADPLLIHVRGSGITNTYTTIFTNWFTQRPPNLFVHFVTNNVWPATGPAIFATPAGSYTNGTVVELANTNGAGQIYYAFDGADPRAPGGAVAGTAYAGGIALDRSRHIKARVLNGAEWSALAEATYSTELPPLYITEIMYHPAGTNALEFVELYNAGSDPVELGPVSFTAGIGFDFASGAVPRLGPGEYVVVVQDLAAFAAAYDTNVVRVAGAFTGKLDNAGERIELSHGYFGVLQSFDYEDDWYPPTDGEGLSLTLRGIHADPETWDRKEGWKASSVCGGSPGAADPGTVPDPGAVVINELLAHTDASPVGDWLELRNTTAHDLDLGGWWLSDDPAAPFKYRIADGTTLPAAGHLVFDTTNHFGAAGQSNAFSFSEYGESAVLSSALDAGGHPTGYRDVREFGASEREVTFGRHVRSDGDEVFVAQAAATKGAANAGPRIGPLVFSEILYDPASNRSDYVEVYCLSPTNVPLYDPAAPSNAWRFTGAGGFAFPAGAVATSFCSFVVAATSPAVFRAWHGLDAGFPVYGPCTGGLDKAGERIRLEMPLQVDGTNRPYATMEEVGYNDKPPWPQPAEGAPISKVLLAAFGNDPAAWQAEPAGKTPGPRVRADSDGDGLPDRWEGARGFDAKAAHDPASDRDSDGTPDVSEYVTGTDPADADDRFVVCVTPTGGAFAVTFLARPAAGAGYEALERRYSLQWAASPGATGWACFAGCSNVLGAGQEVSVVDPLPTNGPVFFRGKVWLMPVE